MTDAVPANFYLGYGMYTARFNRSFYRLRDGERSAYFQDNFRVNSRLTLNLGVRYEFFVPMNDRDNTLVGFDPKSDSVILPQPIDQLAAKGDALPALADAYTKLGLKSTTAAALGLPSNLVYSNKLDFGPRLGFAYRLFDQKRPTVIRGGYSIFGYPEQLRISQDSTAFTIPTYGDISNNPNDAAQSPDGLPNYWIRSTPNIIAGLNSQNALGTAQVTGLTRGSNSVAFMDPHQPTSRAHQWNLTLERDPMPNTVLRTGLVGMHGARMGQVYQMNDATPAYGWYVGTGLPLPIGEYAKL